MKRISLKNVKETLSRKEMRTIWGGYGVGCNTRSECPLGCAVYTGGGHGYCSDCCIA
jgi:natural product precursor